MIDCRITASGRNRADGQSPRKQFQRHTYLLGAPSALGAGTVTGAASLTLTVCEGATACGWRLEPAESLRRQTPLTLENTLLIPFFSFSALGNDASGWAEELMVSSLVATVVVSVLGEPQKNRLAR